jgi:hypothetical protein
MSFRTMDVSDLANNATAEELACFRAACEAALVLHPECDEEAITAAVWGDGNWPENARALGVDLSALFGRHES